MPVPDGDPLRVFARVGVAGLRAGQWGDLPRGLAIRLLNLGYVDLTDDRGVAPPDLIPRVLCC